MNTEFFWNSLCPVSQGGGDPQAGQSMVLEQEINQSFGSRQNMIEIFKEKAEEIRGAGWAWLVFNKQNGNLDVKIT